MHADTFHHATETYRLLDNTPEDIRADLRRSETWWIREIAIAHSIGLEVECVDVGSVCWEWMPAEISASL